MHQVFDVWLHFTRFSEIKTKWNMVGFGQKAKNGIVGNLQ